MAAFGLMRAAQPLHAIRPAAGLLAASGSSRRSSGWPSSPWLLLACVAVGFLLGCQHSRVQPYPVDETAFLQPPSGLKAHELQQQQQQVDHAAAATTAAVQPPSLPSGGSSSSTPTATVSTDASQLFVDAFGQQLLSLSQLPTLRPPLQPGVSGNSFYTAAPYQVLSWYPRIVLFPNFLSAAQQQHVIALAAGRLEPSELGVAGVPFHPAGGRTDGPQVRSSHGVFLDRSADPFLGYLEERIAAVTLIPPSHGEDFNVLNYKPGQHYNSHMDTFDPRFLARADPGFGQRMATFLMYLSDVEEGGETVFRAEGRYGALRHLGDMASCQPGDFKVKPRAGDAILFWSLNHDLSVNPRALHGACPVVKGEKWVMTKWLHDKPITAWDGEGPRQHWSAAGAAAGTA